MSGYMPRDNSGAIFNNTRKHKPNQPDFTGSLVVDGVEYWVSCWNNTAATTGKKYLSVNVTKKDEQTFQQIDQNQFEDFPDFPESNPKNEKVSEPLF